MKVYVLFYGSHMKGIYSTLKLTREAIKRYTTSNKDAVGQMTVKVAKVDPRHTNPRGKRTNNK